MLANFDNSADKARKVRSELSRRLEEMQRFHSEVLDPAWVISPEQIEQLAVYIEFLEKWTSKIDLVSQKSGFDMVIPHIIDSVVALFFALGAIVGKSDLAEATVCDVGSGAGLPGLVWAILRPELKVVLLEPRKRRVDFLGEVRRVLGLENISLLAKRMQEVECSELGDGGSALFVCRALGMEETYLRFCRSICQEGEFASKAMIMAGPNWSCSSAVEAEFGLPKQQIEYSLLPEGPQRLMLSWEFALEVPGA